MPGLLGFLGLSMPSPRTITSTHPAVLRALSAVGTGRYGLGASGRHPEATTPLDAQGRADCSAFAFAWCHGLDKYQPGKIAGDWLWCDGVYADAQTEHRMWRAIPVDSAQPGDCVVYKGARTLGVRRPGHCAVVVAVSGSTWESLDVVDCHGGRGPAIGHRTGALWARKGIVVRRVG